MHQIAKACALLKVSGHKIALATTKKEPAPPPPPSAPPSVGQSVCQSFSQPTSQSVSQSARKPNEWWIACHLQFLLQTKHSSSSLSALSPCLNFSCFSKPTTECEEPSLYNTYYRTWNREPAIRELETRDWRPTTTEYSTLTCWLLSWNLR